MGRYLVSIFSVLRLQPVANREYRFSRDAAHFSHNAQEPLKAKTKNIWATTWQNQQNKCVPSEDRSAWASAQSDQSLLCAQWVAKDPSFLHADSEDSDQTGRMPRLIWVFAGRTCHFVGFVMRQLIYCIFKQLSPLHHIWGTSWENLSSGFMSR